MVASITLKHNKRINTDILLCCAPQNSGYARLPLCNKSKVGKWISLPLITQAISSLWFLIPIALFVTVIKTPWFKGVAGEFIVNVGAKLFLDKETYHLIKNVTLPTEDGSTQIDHVVVSKFGVFVVETKI